MAQTILDDSRWFLPLHQLPTTTLEKRMHLGAEPSLIEPLIVAVLSATDAILRSYEEKDIPQLNFALRPDMIYITPKGFQFSAVFPYPKSQIDVHSSYRYQTPEIIRGGKIRGREDMINSVVWSLGVLLFQLWTGVYPFHSSSAFTELQHIVEYRIKTTGHQLPRSLEVLVKGCTVKDPLHRYPLAAPKQYVEYRRVVMNIIMERSRLPRLPTEIWEVIIIYCIWIR